MKDESLLNLNELGQLGELFRLFTSGKHLNRAADPSLWAEVEQNMEAYHRLFLALGYDLRIDGRGFAWFHSEDASSTVSKSTRQLALLFLVIFEYQADNGRSLHQFYDWILNDELLKVIHEQYQDILIAEDINFDSFIGLLDSAVRYGFAITEGNHWRLLPAVYRYLDHFEALTAQRQAETPDGLENPEEQDDSAEGDLKK